MKPAMESKLEKVDFRSAIARQPGMLEASRVEVLDQILALRSKLSYPGSPLLTATGASYYAALCAASRWHRQGLAANTLTSGELYGAPPSIADTVIAISASGRSAEPIEALRQLKPRLSVGICCTADNPMEDHVDSLIATGCSVDSSPNTASFVGTVQALGLLGDALSGQQTDFSALSGHLDDALSSIRPQIRKAAHLLQDRTSVDLVGNRCAFGIAGYAALLLREFARIPAQSWVTHNFLHGPMEPNNDATAIILFGEEREITLAQHSANFEIPTLLITQSRAVQEKRNLCVLTLPAADNDLIGAIVQAAVAQFLVVEVAEYRGFESCNFRYRQNDTKIHS